MAAEPSSNWLLWALLSAFFAALTAIFAKIGLKGVNPDFATLIRTIVVIVALSLFVWMTGVWSNPFHLPTRTLTFLAASGLAAGASWVCYFRALQVGEAFRVAPIDKLSLLMVAVFAFLFLGERPNAREWIAIVMIGAGVVVLSLRSPIADAAAAEPFKIATRRADDRVEVKSHGDEVTFIVRSPFGIGDATIERTHSAWPAKVTVQLHLKGLEHFKVSTNEVALEASLSRPGGDVRLWKDGHEDILLDSKSPFYIPFRMLHANGQPAGTQTLASDYIEALLPQAFLEGNPQSITLHWIDFYRG